MKISFFLQLLLSGTWTAHPNQKQCQPAEPIEYNESVFELI